MLHLEQSCARAGGSPVAGDLREVSSRLAACLLGTPTETAGGGRMLPALPAHG